MKDPVRLLDDREAPAAARELLRAARAPEPTADQRDALWSAIAGVIGPGPGGGPDGGGPGGGGPDAGGGGPGGSIDPRAGVDLGGSMGSAGGSVPAVVSSASSGAVGVASSTATPLLGAKVVGAPIVGAKVVGSAAATWLGLVAAAGLSVGTAVLVGGPERPAPVVVPAVIGEDGAGQGRGGGQAPRERTGDAPPGAPIRSTPSGSDGAAAPRGAPTTARVDRSPPGHGADVGAGARARSEVDPSKATPTSPEPAPSAAREEVAATTRARELIHAGEPARALAELEAARVRFSGGVLVQERAALTVEALGRSGQHERAAALARAFLDSWPESAHAGLVRPWAR